MIALPLAFLRDDRTRAGVTSHDVPARTSVREVLATLRASATLRATIAGFVLVHAVFVGLAFLQLWLVRERGFDPGAIAKQVGGLQILFGVSGSVVGGVLSDRVARHMAGGHAGFMLVLVAMCTPLMLASRFVEPGSVLFYVGLCAGFFLPLALYGPALAVIQGLTPEHMRATITGTTMLLINVFAIAIGNVAAGAISDRLAAGGSSAPLTVVLVGTDLLALLAAGFFFAAARGPKPQPIPVPAIAH